MIISASRRTDIPALYSQWLMNRLEEGYVLVPAPYRTGTLNRIQLSPENVDCLVLWTKNPEPMLNKQERLDAMGYPHYFQFTLTPYGRDIEPGLPEKAVLEKTFQELAKRCGKERVVWRYDPVLLDEKHTIAWHTEQFRRMCECLAGSTSRCVFSFVDAYQKSPFRTLTLAEMIEISSAFSSIVKDYSLQLFTCAEQVDLSQFGIAHSACIDQNLIEQVIGCPISATRDKNQRAACRCIEAVDIGAYDTCIHGCTYCYGTSGAAAVQRRFSAHDPRSPMIFGWPSGNEVIRDRTMPSQKQLQTSIFGR